MLADTKRRYKMFNGNLLFTYVTRDDLDDINTRIGGISCIYYHDGLYIQSARFVLKRIAGIGFLFILLEKIHKNCLSYFTYIYY